MAHDRRAAGVGSVLTFGDGTDVAQFKLNRIGRKKKTSAELAAAVTDGSGGIGYGGLVRGGAWNFPPRDSRSAVRLALPPEAALKFVGFRVARDAE